MHFFFDYNHLEANFYLFNYKSIFVKKEYQMDPLHGVTLQKIVEALVEEIGWERMGDIIPIRCFQYDPTVKSSLTFLRKTPWARKKVEDLYIERIVQFYQK